MNNADLITQQLIRKELASRDYQQYVEYINPDYIMAHFHRYLSRALDKFVREVEAGLSPRLMIFTPPRHGKSLLSSVYLPTYLLGVHPDWHVIASSYNQRLADNFGRKVRDIVQQPEFESLFPGFTLRTDTRSVNHFETVQGGMYHATGIGGSLTGLGFNVGIIDDPVKDREQADSEVEREKQWDWFSSTFYTRSLRGSGMLIIQTTWHWDEVSQRLLEIQGAEGAEKWGVIELPALAREGDPLNRAPGEALCEELIPREQLLRMRATMDARDWSALYQCRPVPEEGDFFKASDLRTYTTLPSVPMYWYISCDPAISEKDGRAFTVAVLCAVDPQKNVYLHSMFRERTGSKEIVEGIFNLAESAPRRVETIIIEAGHIQKTMKPMLELEAEKRNAYIPMQFPNPISDKETRARPLQYLIENHKVHFKEGHNYAEYIRPELLSFPAGKFKDIVDALSWLAYLLQINACPAPAKNAAPTPDRDVPGTYDNLQARSAQSLEQRLKDRHKPRKMFNAPSMKRRLR